MENRLSFFSFQNYIDHIIRNEVNAAQGQSPLTPNIAVYHILEATKKRGITPERRASISDHQSKLRDKMTEIDRNALEIQLLELRAAIVK